jgi:hypothetical protein
MATLPDVTRRELWAELMRNLSDDREPVSVTKTVLRQAVDAADQWVSDNALSYNQALPAAFRSTATPEQKARLLMLVLKIRYRDKV